MDLVFSRQFFMDIIEQAIDELTTLNGTVSFGKVYIFIDRDLGRDGFKI